MFGYLPSLPLRFGSISAANKDGEKFAACGLTGGKPLAPRRWDYSRGVPDAYEYLSEFEIRELARGSPGTFMTCLRAAGLGDKL